MAIYTTGPAKMQKLQKARRPTLRRIEERSKSQQTQTTNVALMDNEMPLILNGNAGGDVYYII